MSEQHKTPWWSAPLKSLKRELGMLLFIVVAVLVCTPFILAVGWLGSKLPEWLFWLLMIPFWMGMLFQGTIKSAWHAYRGGRQ